MNRPDGKRTGGPWVIRPRVGRLGLWARYETLRCFGPITRANSVLLAMTFPPLIACGGAVIGLTSWQQAFVVAVAGAVISIGFSFALGPFGSQTIQDVDGYNARIEMRLSELRDALNGRNSEKPLWERSEPGDERSVDMTAQLFAQEPRHRRVIAASTVATLAFLWAFLSTSSGGARTLFLVLEFAQLLLVARVLRSRRRSDTPAPRAHPHPRDIGNERDS